MSTFLAAFLLLTTSLLSALPARALDFTGSAIIDWGSLTINGVPIQLDTEGPNIQGEAALLFGPRETQTGGNTYALYDVFQTHTESMSLPMVGIASGSADPSSLTASVQMQGLGDAGSSSYRTQLFHTLGAGALSISVQYTMAHAGIPPLSVATLSSTLLTTLDLGALNSTGLHTEAALSTAGQQSGTLTLTRQFQAGEIGGFTTSANVTTHVGQSVPIPSTLWSLLLGLVGVGWIGWWARRQGQERRAS